MQALVVECFIDAIYDRFVKQQLFVRKPETINEAIFEARRLSSMSDVIGEPVFPTKPNPSQKVRNCEMYDHWPENQQNEQTKVVNELRKLSEQSKNEICQLRSELEQLKMTPNQPKQNDNQTKPKFLKQKKPVICYNCKLEGHLKKYCPFRPGAPTPMVQTTPYVSEKWETNPCANYPPPPMPATHFPFHGSPAYSHPVHPLGQNTQVQPMNHNVPLQQANQNAPLNQTAPLQPMTQNVPMHTVNQISFKQSRAEPSVETWDGTAQGPIERIHVTYESGMFVRGQIENVGIDLLVDTGCTCTLVSERIFDAISHEQKPELIPYNGTLLSADDSPIAVRGKAVINIKIGSKWLRQMVIVAAVSNDGYLGMDFLESNQVNIDFGKKQIKFGDESLSVSCRKGWDRACRVVLSEGTLLPPNSRTIVLAEAQKPLASGDWCVEPLSKTPGNRPVLVAKSVFRGNGTKLPVEILNPTDDNVLLYERTHLAITTKLDNVQYVNLTVSDSPSHVNETKDTVQNKSEDQSSSKTQKHAVLPEEIQLLYENVTLPMEENDQKQVLELLSRHKVSFLSKVNL